MKWNIFNNDTRETQEIAGSATLIAKPGESFRVSLIAEDPEGIREITLGKSSMWSCSADGLVKQNGPGLTEPAIQTLHPDSKGTVLTTIFLISETSFGPYDCQSGFTFDGATIHLIGTGENYFKGVTRADLVFTVAG
jgi:hypothetical protein